MRLFQREWSWNWNPEPKTHFVIVLSLTVLTAILCLVSLAYAIHQVTNNPVVQGTVVKSVSNVDGKHTPIIEYNNPNVGITQFRSRLSTRPQRYFVGDTVEVILVGQDFEPKLKSFFSVYGLSAFFFMFSSISALGTFVVYRTRVKK